jgi:hypothetical protein
MVRFGRGVRESGHKSFYAIRLIIGPLVHPWRHGMKLQAPVNSRREFWLPCPEPFVDPVLIQHERHTAMNVPCDVAGVGCEDGAAEKAIFPFFPQAREGQRQAVRVG